MNNQISSAASIAVLIPCYNCGPAVVDVVRGVRAYTERILLVNDGSTDDTADWIRQCDAETLGWPVNQGKGAALMEGFRHFLRQPGWEALVTMDSDGQHAPADLAQFINLDQQNLADMIVGKRSFQTGCVPAHRRWANKLSSRLITALSGCTVGDIQCGYRWFRRGALETLLPHVASSTYAIETEMALLAQDLGLRLGEVEIQCIYSEESSRRSSWKPLADSWRIARVVARHLLRHRPKKALVKSGT